MTTRIKICGLTRKEDVLFAAEAGADYLGFVFVPDSPRAITPEQLTEFVSDIPESVKTVGVFKDEDDREIRRVMEWCSLDIVQLHGTEPPAFADLLALEYDVWKALPFRQTSDFSICEKYHRYPLLLDSDKKRGQCSWRLAQLLTRRRMVMLAGGLNPQNVRNAIETVMPYGVDVASGVESAPGIKDHQAILEFINQVRLADNNLEESNENTF